MTSTSAEPKPAAWDIVRIVLAAVIAGIGIWYYGFHTPVTYVSRDTVGKTMGTDYIVKAAAVPESADWQKIADQIQTILDDTDAKMSTYRQDSEVCRFNVFRSTEEWFPVSPETARVVQAALEIAELSGETLDITAAPLVELWGFGAGKTGEAGWMSKTLSELETASLALKEKIGYRKLTVRLEPPALKKAIPELSIDLSAIAKGFAVDRIAEFLHAQKLTDYMIEVGGEVRCGGKKTKEKNWVVGIEKPPALPSAAPTDAFAGLQQRLVLTDCSLATSGNYRQLRQIEGHSFSHIIDPRTCLPAPPMDESDGQLLSVSVIASDCMLADAWATALYVLGVKEGLALADKQGLAVLFLLHRSGTVREEASKKWKTETKLD